MTLSTSMTLRNAAWLCAWLVLSMLGIFLVTGIGQDPLQYVHPASDYAQLLLKNPPVLRLAIGLDNLFILSYATVFVLLSSQLLRDGGPRLLIALGLGFMLATALLDMVENFHFLTLLSAAEQGHGPTDDAIAWQAAESMFKFHVSYLGLLLFGLALPRSTPMLRTLATLLVAVQWPVGVAIYVSPPFIALPLVFVRFAFFLASFTLVARINWRDASGSGARV